MGASDKFVLIHGTRNFTAAPGPNDTDVLEVTIPTAGGTLAANPVATVITTRGDLIQGDAAGDPARLARGTNAQVVGMNAAGTDIAWIAACRGAVTTAIDLSAVANTSIALAYGPGLSFIPTAIVVTCTVAMTGDAKLTFGTSAGNAEIQAETTMTGLTTGGQRFVIPVTAKVIGAIAGNATLYTRVTTTDSTATGRVTVRFIGQII